MSTLPSDWQGHGIEPVGYHDLAGRPGFKITIRQSGERWLLYLAHFWDSGWSILDVTDPSRTELLRFIEGPENTATLQVDLAEDYLVTALEKHMSGFGGDPSRPFDEGVLIWSLEDPASPRRLGQFRTGGTGTHRNGYYGGRYAHLAANMDGYEGNIYVILDLADPEHPVEAGRWWVPGQHTAGGQTPTKPGISLHGPPVLDGDLVYLPYGSAGAVVLDISDVSAPRLVGDLPFSPPFRLQFGVHSIVLHQERSLAYLNSEGVVEPRGTVPPFLRGHDHISVVDISDPGNLELVSIFPRPLPPAGASYADFLDRPGWSGPHNQSQLHHNPDVAPQGDLVHVTYFNAGLRVFDVSEPRQPREVAWFLPPDPTRRYGPLPNGDLVVQSEDVLVDRRGFIYVTDKNQGLWVLRMTAPPA
ncbi:LVIVD repeat-containing protein [Nocardioides marmoraquaticus]